MEKASVKEILNNMEFCEENLYLKELIEKYIIGTEKEKDTKSNSC